MDEQAKQPDDVKLPEPSRAADAAAEAVLNGILPRPMTTVTWVTRIIELHTGVGRLRAALEKARDWHAMFPNYANPDMLETLNAALAPAPTAERTEPQ